MKRITLKQEKLSIYYHQILIVRPSHRLKSMLQRATKYAMLTCFVFSLFLFFGGSGEFLLSSVFWGWVSIFAWKPFYDCQILDFFGKVLKILEGNALRFCLVHLLHTAVCSVCALSALHLLYVYMEGLCSQVYSKLIISNFCSLLGYYWPNRWQEMWWVWWGGWKYTYNGGNFTL